MSLALSSAVAEYAPLRIAFLQKHARDVNGLSDQDKHKRKRALDSVSREVAQLPSHARAHLVVLDLHRQISSLLADPAELNRESSIVFLRSIVDAITAPPGEADSITLPAMLSYLIPTYTARISIRGGGGACAEDSEELRLQLVQLLNIFLTSKSCFEAISNSFADLAEVAKGFAMDAYHNVKVEAATAMQLLCVAAPSKVRLSLAPLVSVCVGNMSHQRGPVRLSSLLAIEAMLPLGVDGLQTVMLTTALPALRTLRFDRTPGVRKALAASVAKLLSSLPNELLSVGGCEAQLILLSLALMADETEEVTVHALQSFEVAASARRQNLESGGNRLHSQIRPQEDSVMSVDLQTAAAAAAPDASIQGYDGAAEAAQAMSVALGNVPATSPTAVPNLRHGDISVSLPPPFKSRPSTDAQWITQRILPTLSPILITELKDWTVRVRQSSAGAFRSLMVFIEDAATSRLDEFILALCTGSRDEDTEVRKILGDVGRLLGAFVPAPAQLAVLLPQLKGEVAGLNNVQHYASALAVLAAAVSSMSRESLLLHVEALSLALSLPSLADEEPKELRRHLAASLAFLVRVAFAGEVFTGSSVATSAQSSASMVDCQENAPFPALLSSSPDLTEFPPRSASRSHIISDIALDALLLALINLQDIGAPQDILASGLQTQQVLARALRFESVSHLYASRIHSFFPLLVREAKVWGKTSHGRKQFDTLLRRLRSSLCGRNENEARKMVEGAIEAFVNSLAVSKDAELRVTQMALLDAFICNSDGAKDNGDADASMKTEEEEFAVSNKAVDGLLADNSGILMQQALIPNSVWRVGLVASTIRKVSCACMLSLAQRSLLPLHSLQPIFSELLPVVKSNLADDDATTRHVSCLALGLMLKVLRRSLDGETVRLLYPEVLKRLDDSNDAVRSSACSAIAAVATCAARPDEMQGTSAEYSLDILLVHLDDTDPGIQAAVFEATVPYLSLVSREYALKALKAARETHRHPALCDKLLMSVE